MTGDDVVVSAKEKNPKLDECDENKNAVRLGAFAFPKCDIATSKTDAI